MMDSLLCSSNMKIIQIPRLWAYKGEREVFLKDEISRWTKLQKKLKINVLEHMLNVRKLQDCQEECFGLATKLSARDDLVEAAVASLPKYRGTEQLKSKMKQIRKLRKEQLHKRSQMDKKLKTMNKLLATEIQKRTKIVQLSSCLRMDVEETLKRQIASGLRTMPGINPHKHWEIQKHVEILTDLTSKKYVFSILPETMTDYKVQPRIEKSYMVKSRLDKRSCITLKERVCQLNGDDSQNY